MKKTYNKTNIGVHFTSISSEWQTPVDLYNLLDEEFHFTLDPSSTDENHKCKKYYTKKDDGLNKSWKGETVFMNPPYGREIVKWISKAYQESLQDNTIVVCLVPARVDTKWFHNYCVNGKIRFLKGRLKFINRTLPSWREDGNFKLTGAPFPSMIVIFDGGGWRMKNPPMSKKYKYVEYSQ